MKSSILNIRKQYSSLKRLSTCILLNLMVIGAYSQVNIEVSGMVTPTGLNGTYTPDPLINGKNAWTLVENGTDTIAHIIYNSNFSGDFWNISTSTSSDDNVFYSDDGIFNASGFPESLDSITRWVQQTTTQLGLPLLA